MSYRRPPAE